MFARFDENKVKRNSEDYRLLASEINIFNYFLIGLFLVSFGILGFNSGKIGIKYSFNILGFAFLALGISRLLDGVLTYIYKKSGQKSLVILQHGLIYSIAGLIIIESERIAIFLFSLGCSLVLGFIGLTKLISYILLRDSQVRYNIGDLISAIFYGLAGLGVLLSPDLHIDDLVKIISVWLIIYGLSYWSFCLIGVVPQSQRNSLKRKIRLPLPVFIAALLPDIARQNINKLIEINPEEIESRQLVGDKKPNIEVLVHAGPEGFNRIGHVDLLYKNKIISYGNYDEDSRSMREMIGDGVLFVAESKDYINLAIRESEKTLVGFGLNLDKAQIEAIDERLAELESQVVEWSPDGRKKSRYSAKLKNEAKAKFYKFKSGKFKKYFVFTTNCVLLADQIIGSSGLDIVKINGIITPGSFYDCLNREFKARSGVVVSRNIYR